MPDYGHQLAFGTFLTPQNRKPADVVALAKLTEQSGLDLATFQDHPYQPDYLDTWTLLTWVAAQTMTLRISGNVLNLPLRPPAVLARAAASLDLLSDGRFELALGSGAFWDGIEAMGGGRLTPGQAVDALSEAIEVIRQIWDTSERGGVRVDGEHYKVKGAKRGPAPAHDIAIWLGAYKPRMLRLTGSKANGWLPSMAFMQPDEYAPANARIDDAAEEAGRDPREIRRMLNLSGEFGSVDRGMLSGPPSQWVQQLLALVRDHGFSTFFLSSDDPRAIATFGREVAPALREAVERERRDNGTASGEVRSRHSLQLRRDGIDYDNLPVSLATAAVEPGDHDFARVRSTYIRSGSPGLVLRPNNVEEVVTALEFARGQDVPLAIRSGGHGISGRSTNDGGIVISLAALDRIEILDPASGRFRVGPGARWGDVAQALAPHGLAMSSGDYGGVGVGGLTTAGGVGFLVRKYGLTLDHLVAAEVVLADGRVVRTDAETEPDLFWAIRGAGGNFGIVTSFELDAYKLGPVVFSTMAFESPDLAGLLQRWGSVVEAAPRELTSFLNLFTRRGGMSVVQLYSVYADEDTDAATAALTPLLEIGQLLEQQAQLLPYAAIIQAESSGGSGAIGSTPAFRAGLLNHVSAEASAAIVEALDSGATGMIQIRPLGGAVNDIDPAATAFPHRSQNFALNATSSASRRDRLNDAWDRLAPHLDGLYLSFDSDQRPDRLAEAFPGPALEKLRRLKAVYDPDNVFNQNFPIPPATGTD